MNREVWPLLRKLLSPIAQDLDDPEVTDIFINGPEEVYVDARSGRRRSTGKFSSVRQLEAVIRHLAQEAELPPEESHLTMELPDGSRVHAISGRLAHSGGGPWISIRRHVRLHLDGQALVRAGTVPHDLWNLLVEDLVERRYNLLIAGPTGAGKTAFAEALLRALPPTERVLLLQDVEEIVREDERWHWGSFRPGPDGYDALLRSLLRMQPDRLALGELRGSEAWTLLEAFSTGHAGGVTTLHATHAMGALRRLETLALQHAQAPSADAIRARVGDTIQVVVQMARSNRHPTRYVQEVVRVGGVLGHGYEIEPIYQHKDRGSDH